MTDAILQIEKLAEDFLASSFRKVAVIKHKKASKEEDTMSYSSFVRMLNDEYDERTVEKFQTLFKEFFDRFYLLGHEEPEQEALEHAITSMQSFHKQANAIEMGNPADAGARLAEMVKFLLRRVPQERRDKSIQSVRRKIFMLNENEIASKQTPPSSSMGQSVSIIKTILLENSPQYIRQVLNAITRNL